jgi:CDP-diacylglycerol--serine O-phosphatidyltransferase
MAVRKIVIVPTLLTLGNAVCGLASIAYASRIGKDGFDQVPAVTYLAISGWLILAAMVFDTLDGLAARLSKSSGRFGAELDSLCDAVSFGAAPAFLLLQLGPDWNQPIWHRLLAAVATLYLMCTILRLARYNVESMDGSVSAKRFRGLPSPAAAGCIAALAILRASYADETARGMFEAWATVGAFLVALLMVSQVSYPHLTKQMLRGGRTAVPLMLTAVVIVALAREMAVALLFWGYALLGLGRHVVVKVTRRDKSLAGVDERRRFGG